MKKNQFLVAMLLLCCLYGAKAQSISGSLGVCLGQPTTLSNSTPGGSWSSSNAGVGTIDVGGVLSGLSAGTTIISYTTDTSLSTAVATVNAVPEAISGISTVCSGATTNLFCITGGGTWSSSNTSIATINSSGVVSGVASGTTVVTYELATGCYATTTVSVDPTPAAIGGVTFRVCEGSTITLTNTVPGGTWASSETYFGTIGITNGVLYGRPIGATFSEATFDVIYTVCTNTVTATMTLTPLVEIINYPIAICVGDTQTFHADQAGGTWSVYVGSSFVTIDTYTGFANATAPGDMRIAYTLPSVPSCVNNSTYTDNIKTIAMSGSISGNMTVCKGQVTRLHDNAAYGTWSSSNTSVATVNNVNGIGVLRWDVDITGVDAGTSTITYRLTPACYTIAEVTVLPLPDEITGTLSSCIGHTSTLSSVSAGGTWSSSNTGTATVGSANGIVTGVATGTATITYTVPSGCYTTTVFTVSPSPVADPSYDTLVCSGGTLRFYANDEGGNTYLWTGPSSFSSTVQNPTRSSVTTGVNGTYTLVVTSAAGCSSTYTLDVLLLTSPFSVSVSQTAPFAISGDKVYTYSSTGFALDVVTTPALPSTGVNYTWTGAVTGTSTVSAFSPTFASTTTLTTKVYTVTVTYNGCTSSDKNTIMLPPEGCSPYNHFSVNAYRTYNGMDTLADCDDCDDVQPFHTINANQLNDDNIVDGENYYVTNKVTCKKTSLNNNNFFMGYQTVIYIDTVTPVQINNCHFFAGNSCFWWGLYVIPGKSAAGQLKITNNTLIENAGGPSMISWGALFAAGVNVPPSDSGYYAAGMEKILDANGVFFNKNYDGVAIATYMPKVATLPKDSTMPFSIRNCVFAVKELALNDTGHVALNNYPFSWPTVASLKTITHYDTVPTFGIDAYINNPLSNFGHAGVYANSVGEKVELSPGDATTPATYSYNYLTIGDPNPDSASVSTNLYDSTLFGVMLVNSNAKLYNNVMSNMKLYAVLAGYAKNDLQIIGSRADNTNNRIYNCNQAIRIGGNFPYAVWDFTCSDADVKAVQGVTGMVDPGLAMYMVLDGEHSLHNVRNNYFYNYPTGIIYQYLGGTYGVNVIPRKGSTYICNNTFVGRTTAEGTRKMNKGIEISDSRVSPDDEANGYTFIDSNTMDGVSVGVDVYSKSQQIHINDNKITFYSFASTVDLYGVYAWRTPYLAEVKRNKVTGFGNKCYTANSHSHTGFYMSKVGSATMSTDVSCNLTEDINVGFRFAGDPYYGNTSYVQWTHNEMRRNRAGLYLTSAAEIGQQGDACNPTDNKWTGSACTSGCGSCSDFVGWGADPYSTYVLSDVNVALSPIYVRYDSSNLGGGDYIPHGNFSTGYQPYSYANNYFRVSAAGDCGHAIEEETECGPEYASKGIAGDSKTSTEIDKHNQQFQLFPNPNNGNMTIELTELEAQPVHIRVINAVGSEVYSHLHTFDSRRTTLSLQHLQTGIYMVQLTYSNGERNTARVVIAN